MSRCLTTACSCRSWLSRRLLGTRRASLATAAEAKRYAGPALDAISCGRRKPRPPWWGMLLRNRWGMVVRADTDSVGFDGELTLGLNIARGR